MRPEFDVIVVGAGVAGSTTALLLGRAGFRVLLLEKARFPRSKVCGEGLMPSAVKALDRLDLLCELQQADPQPFWGVGFYPQCGKALELDFREVSASTRGLVLPRLHLDSLLAARAGRQPGVTLVEGFLVRKVRVLPDRVLVAGAQGRRRFHYSARAAVGADGIHSRFHRDLSISRRLPRRGRFALRCYHSFLRGGQPLVEVHFSPAGEAYVAPHSRQGVLVALLLFQSVDSRAVPLADLYWNHLRRFPLLWERLGEPPAAHVPETTAPLSLKLSRSHHHRVLLAGDAAGAADPVTGQGMTVALKDAELAAGILTSGLRGERLSEPDLRIYTAERNRHFLPSCRLAELFLAVFHRPFLADRAIKCLSQNQALKRKVVGIASDVRPLQSLSWGDRLRLVLGW